jgi:hypothetical protein
MDLLLVLVVSFVFPSVNHATFSAQCSVNTTHKMKHKFRGFVSLMLFSNAVSSYKYDEDSRYPVSSPMGDFIWLTLKY